MTTPAPPAEPAAIWSTRRVVFDKEISLTQNVILSQGSFALSAMIERIDHLYQILGAVPQLVDTYPHPGIPQCLTEICLHQGIASSILFNDSGRGHKESATSYRLRIDRSKYVQKLCREHGVVVTVLTDRKVRNRLMHVDEYLATALAKPNAGWMIDSAIAFRDALIPPNGLSVNYCRTFIASEEIILHLGTEIPVRQLRDEATGALAGVFGIPPIEPPPSPAHSRQVPRV